MIKKLLLSSLLALSVVLPVSTFAYSSEYEDYINSLSWAYEQNYQVPSDNVWSNFPFNSSYNVFPKWQLLQDSIDSYTSLDDQWYNLIQSQSNWWLWNSEYNDYLSMFNCSQNWYWYVSAPQNKANVMQYIWYFCYNENDFQCYDSVEEDFDSSCIVSLVQSQKESYSQLNAMYNYVKNNPSVMLNYDDVYEEINWIWSNPWQWGSINTPNTVSYTFIPTNSLYPLNENLKLYSPWTINVSITDINDFQLDSYVCQSENCYISFKTSEDQDFCEFNSDWSNITRNCVNYLYPDWYKWSLYVVYTDNKGITPFVSATVSYPWSNEDESWVLGMFWSQLKWLVSTLVSSFGGILPTLIIIGLGVLAVFVFFSSIKNYVKWIVINRNRNRYEKMRDTLLEKYDINYDKYYINDKYDFLKEKWFSDDTLHKVFMTWDFKSTAWKDYTVEWWYDWKSRRVYRKYKDWHIENMNTEYL